MNARSICKPGKFDELKCIIRSIEAKTHLVLLTETWIKSADEAESYQIPNYTHYYNIRTDSRGGGVSIYIHNDIKHSLNEESYTGGINYLWISIERYALDIGIVYNPGSSNIKDFLETYSEQLVQKRRAIVFGDFNLDLLKTERSVKLYKDMLKESGYYFINKIEERFCTRETASTKTIIDHVCTNIQMTFHMVILDSPMSDHKQIYLNMKKLTPPDKRRIQYDAINYDELYKIIKNHTYNPTQHTYEHLEKHIQHGIKNSKTKKFKIMNQTRLDK